MSYLIKPLVLCCGLFGVGSAWAMDLRSADQCQNNTSPLQAVSCGTIEGALRLNSFSLNNAYFSGNSQDTTTAGGYATYKTAPWQGIQLAVGVEGQKHLQKGDGVVSELSQDTFGLGEAYIQWKNQDWRITVGNQRLNLPFMGDYSNFRVQPWLYQAIDIQYGDTDNFIRATKVHKYKSYGDDEFSQGSRLKDDSFLFTQDGKKFTQDIDGVIGLGLGKTWKLDDKTVQTQAWIEHYPDVLNLYYADAKIKWQQKSGQPEIAVQGIYGKETGDAYLGNINSRSVGARLTTKPKDNLTWKLSYVHVFKDKDAWANGSLPTPYAHNTSSDPYFAQPFFTSTQDLGAGDFVSTELSGNVIKNLFAGSRLTYVKADKTANLPGNSNMYEWMFYGFYSFPRAFKNLSLGEFIGFQKHEGDKNAFLQNRLTLNYKF